MQGIVPPAQTAGMALNYVRSKKKIKRKTHKKVKSTDNALIGHWEWTRCDGRCSGDCPEDGHWSLIAEAEVEKMWRATEAAIRAYYDATHTVETAPAPRHGAGRLSRGPTAATATGTRKASAAAPATKGTGDRGAATSSAAPTPASGIN